MVTQRQLVLFQALLTQPFVSLETFLSLTNMSERTVRYDISSLRSVLVAHDVSIKYAPGKGFYIPINQKVLAENFLLQHSGVDKATEDKDMNHVLENEMVLILATQRYTSIFELAERLYLSETKAREVIQNVTERYGTKLKISSDRGKGFYLDGDEFEIRKVVSGILESMFENASQMNQWYVSLKMIHDLFPKSVMDAIINDFKSQNLKYQVWYTNDKFVAVLSYLFIQWLRVEYFLSNESHKDSIDDVHAPHLAPITYAYCKDILHHVDIADELYEVVSAQRILKENGIYINDRSIADQHLLSAIDDIVAYLRTTEYCFDIESLQKDLFLHLQLSTVKETPSMDTQERYVLEQIQEKYLEFYTMAEICSELIRERIGKQFSDIEISYIAIYLYKNADHDMQRKRVIVVCSTGRGLSTLLTTRIRHVFPNIEVVETMSVYQLINRHLNNDIDFIISTVDIEDIGVPVIKISVVLSQNDIQQIQSYLREDVHIEYQFKSSEIELPNSDINSQNLVKYSEIVNSIILQFIELVSSISSEYHVEYDALLGLLIHIHLAIPRWAKGVEEGQEDQIDEYLQIQSEHPALAKQLDAFFSRVEHTLFLTLPINERLAFYTYIVRRTSYETDSN